jgi:hypothetical protein
VARAAQALQALQEKVVMEVSAFNHPFQALRHIMQGAVAAVF